MTETEQKAKELLIRVGAIVSGHFILTGGLHSDTYINKDALYPHTKETSLLCREIARQFIRDDIETVIGPALGGINLSQRVAEHLSDLCGREVLSIFAEPNEDAIYTADEYSTLYISKGFSYPYRGRTISRTGTPTETTLCAGDKIIRRGKEFIIKRGYGAFAIGKNVLVVEDILTTGNTAKEVIRAVRQADGNVVGLAALVNRGGVKPESVENPPKFFSLITMPLQLWNESECPLCRTKNVPVRTDMGKG